MRAMMGWLTVALLAACSDGGRSRLDGIPALDAGPADGAPPDDGAAEADAGPSPDAVDASPDASDPPDAAPEPRCRFEIETLDDVEPTEGHPIVDGDTVYVSALGPDGIARTVRAADRAPVGGPSDQLLAARGGAFLLLRPDGDGGRRLIYRDGRGDRALGTRRIVLGGGPIDRRPPQWVEPGQAIFIDGETLYHWSGEGEPRAVDERVIEAALVDGHIGYVTAVDLPGFQLWLDGQSSDVRGAFVGGTLRGTATGLWFGSGRWVERLPWSGADDPEALMLDEPVLALDVRGDDAVVVAGAPDGVELFGIGALADPRALFDPIGAGVTVVTRVFAGGWLRADWPEPDAWCAGQAPGALTWTDGDAVVELGRVTAGCLCCGMFWPRFTVEASATTVAWSYADGRGVGIARRVCD